MMVYVISATADPNHVKIGRSASPFGRLAELQCGNPHKLNVYFIASLGTDLRASEVEHTVHRLLSDRRLVGEWFHVTVQEAISACKEVLARLDHGIELDRSNVIGVSPLDEWKAKRDARRTQPPL